MLSVEPKNVGPACFSAHGVDPAMFRLDICIVDGQEKITSPAASSVSTSLSISQSPKVAVQADGTSHENKNSNECMSVFLQIDRTFVFQVDLSQLRGVYLLEKSAAEKPTNQSTCIPFFLLHFDSCSFRIFSEQANNNDSAPLKSAAARLKKAVFQRVTTSYPCEHPLLRNSDCSGRSNNKFGQHGSCDSHVEDSRHNKRGEADSVPSDSESQSVRRVKQRKTSLTRSWEGLQSLQAVLDMPHEAVPKAHNLADTIGLILTTTADELSSSYCRSIDLVRALQSCNDDIIQCEKELDSVFAAGFPPPRTKQRRGMNSSPATIPEVIENSQVLLETAQGLLNKHKERVKQRLGLSLMPIRD